MRLPPNRPDEQRRRLRTALLSVDSRVSFPGLSGALPSFARPLSIEDSLKVIDRAPPRWREHARTVAAVCLDRLATQGSPQGDAYLETLVGEAPARQRRQRRAALRTRGRTEGPPTRARQPVQPTQPLGLPPSAGCPDPEDEIAERPLLQVDPDTLITSAHIEVALHVPAHTTVEMIARCVDPLAWADWPFWEAAYRVEPDGRDGFKQLPPSAAGKPWNGLFYEYAIWDGDPGVIAAYQNLLRIAFRVAEDASGVGEVKLHYGLQESMGSMLLGKIQEGGVDVDKGSCEVAVGPPGGVDGHPGCRAVRAIFEKNVRFSDLLTRSTAGQGRPGTGLAINLMAPAVVGLWMHQLALGAAARWRTLE